MTPEKTYDLGDKKSAVSGRAKPINVRLGDYLVKTSGIEEKVCLDPGRGKTKVILDVGDYYGWVDSENEPWGKPLYGLAGKLSVSKMRKETGTRKKYLGLIGPEISFERETTDWTLEVDGDDGDHQLYRPKYLAEELLEEAKRATSLENQGLELNLQSLTDLLTEALDPYVQRGDYFCGEGKQFEGWGKYYHMRNSNMIEEGRKLLSFW